MAFTEVCLILQDGQLYHNPTLLAAIVLIITLQIDHFSSKGTLGNGHIHEYFKELPAFIVGEGFSSCHL